ncbi:MAG: hypothetical protein KF891_08035 [Rhizobacter sp.]|nr:hypothetical protein [Rhizobacter sp.]
MAHLPASRLPVTRFVRNVLLADAVVSGAAAAVMLLGGEWLYELLQLPAWLMVSGGLTLVAYTALVGWLSRRPSVARPVVWAVVAVNVVWAIDCATIAFGGWLQPSLWGQLFLGAHIATVLVFAELQLMCLRRASRPGAQAYA